MGREINMYYVHLALNIMVALNYFALPISNYYSVEAKTRLPIS
jgi:hypothetical protein